MSVHEDVTKKLNGISNASTGASNADSASTGYIDQIPGW